MSLRILLITLFLSLVMTMSSQVNKNDYLKKVLSNLEMIETASYHLFSQSWEPGDTIVNVSGTCFMKEYNNPNDTTIGASWVTYTDNDMKTISSCYDGHVHVSFYHDKNGVVVNDFTSRKLPFRPLTPPFFNYAKNIIKYALTTNDRISVDVKNCDDDYLIKLVINEDEQVEFFGAGYHIPKPPFDLLSDPTSTYELWISKSNNLPYKFRREMSHNISTGTCFDVQLNNLSAKSVNATDYIPERYEVREYGKKYNTTPLPRLMGENAPDWTLMDINEQMVSLSELDSKVILIEFTGIGCGPCMASIPFLNELKNKYSSEDLTVVAIETWNRKTHSLKNYANKYKINYTFLSANDDVVENYQTGMSAPSFFILDKHRKVIKVIKGYSQENTKQEITDLINELLK